MAHDAILAIMIQARGEGCRIAGKWIFLVRRTDFPLTCHVPTARAFVR